MKQKHFFLFFPLFNVLLQLLQTSLGPWLEKCQKMFLACMWIMRFARSDQAMDGEEEASGPTFCDSGPREGRGGIKHLRHKQVCFPKKILFGQLPPILRVLVHANSSQNLCVRKPLGTCLP